MNNIFDEAIRVGKEANARALKPCPFCGGRYAGLHQETTADGEFIMYIECHNCGARGSVKSFPKVQFADIRSTWNDRADNFLDEYLFRGGTLREWIEKIERGEIRAERRGHFSIVKNTEGVPVYLECSHCRNRIFMMLANPKYKFCPRCGAKMNGGKDDK